MEKNLKKDPGIIYVDVITPLVTFFIEADFIPVFLKYGNLCEDWDVKGYSVHRGGAVALWLVRSGFKCWSGTLCCVLGQD